MAHSRSVTLATIARRCRVSVATVSKALSDEPSRCDLSAGTVARIRTAAHGLDYRAGWRRARLRPTIALVLPGANQYLSGAYFDLIPHLVRACDYEDAILVIMAMATGATLKTELTRRQVRGAILLQAENAWMEQALPSRFPLVLYNNQSPLDCVQVMPDEVAHVALAVDHLASLGHRRFCYLDFPSGHGHCSGGLRRQAMGAADGRDGRSVVTITGRCGLLGAIDAGATAVVAADGGLALTALGWLAEAGRRVPDEVSLLAMSQADLLAKAWPAIACIRHPVEAMVAAALQAILAPPEGPRFRLFSGHVVAGGSCARPGSLTS